MKEGLYIGTGPWFLRLLGRKSMFIRGLGTVDNSLVDGNYIVDVWRGHIRSKILKKRKHIDGLPEK